MTPRPWIVTPSEAYRVALAAAPFAVCSAHVYDSAPGLLVVTVALWPDLEDWSFRVVERVRRALDDSTPADLEVVVAAAENRGPA